MVINANDQHKRTEENNPRQKQQIKYKLRSKHQKKQRKTPTSLTPISGEPWHAVTGVVVYTVFTRSTVLTRVIDTFIDIF